MVSQGKADPRSASTRSNGISKKAQTGPEKRAVSRRVSAVCLRVYQIQFESENVHCGDDQGPEDGFLGRVNQTQVLTKLRSWLGESQ